MRIPLLCVMALIANAPMATAQLKLRDLPGTPKPFRPAAECAADTLLRPPIPHDALFKPAQAREMVLPAPEARQPKQGSVFAVDLHVTSLGKVDSVVIAGPPVDPRYRASWVHALEGYRFTPASARGCAVDDWYHFGISF